ncbi:ABC transporter, CydDC cysteine exporter (CydDC- E) family, permease/ATP-binding protein CydD [Xylanimonas cellulosilytica DSM 15894]|uniref:ABC transporter, CydDC cysteine exporter (CydDC-E) family, permease/ATP-binding protein CydD n=1 Tax=Xylanimonas cellulosilytica (strain DSM 15894 / JCM 12276 / CECT 5975 / KCTC 9989 / LMG 20990 / NBRC 107835 / XIL07) TaxID=446471 RepID=D1BV48_XYLCX|nr:ABC transporter transmembrane domain-containing protein [Xylanimonas cellulosilytica]ACZ31287.1 ABC transporter, CydDC cysteine exporter (CydDC- E) family, permease/ATP-binding protein CydD [Xylanimonas cellulosilytica DSM 15894]
MKPFDPRLLQRTRAARRYVVLTAALGLASALLIVGQALLVASLLGALVAHGSVPGPTALRTLGALAGVAAGRGLVAWAQERFAQKAAARTIAELRSQLVAHAVTLGPRWASGARRAEVATLATRGLDALEPYLVRYLPSLLLTALVTPAVLVVLGALDWVSLLVCLVTLPLVPLFMWLVGLMTQGTSERRLVVVQRLGAQVLDLLAGLPTLRAFGREIGPGARVRSLGEASKKATMGTLRVAFLSGMVLELLTTLSVAVVAVGVGLRLVHGSMTLTAGLAVIMLAPEVYLPLRAVGAQFHASTDGLAAASSAFALLEAGVDGADGADGLDIGPAGGLGREVRADVVREMESVASLPRISRTTSPLPSLTDGVQVSPGGGLGTGVSVRAVVLDGVSVRAGDRAVEAPSGLSARIELGTGRPGGGRVIVLRGPSGAGKSTTVDVLLGLLRPDAGSVSLELSDARKTLNLGGSDTSEEWRDWWWSQVVWVPQRPAIAPGTLRDVVAGGVRGDDESGAGVRDDDEHRDHEHQDREREREGCRHRVHRTRDGDAGLHAAARTTGLDVVVAGLADGWDTRVGVGGVGLSVGQRQRVALTTALVAGADRPVVVLDEPTAHLDAAGEQVVLDTVRAWRDAGRTVIVVAHRESVVGLADQVIDVHAQALTAEALTAEAYTAVGA